MPWPMQERLLWCCLISHRSDETRRLALLWTDSTFHVDNVAACCASQLRGFGYLHAPKAHGSRLGHR